MPSLPFWPTASLPEVIWAVAAAIGTCLAGHAWLHNREPHGRTKNAIRFVASVFFLVTGAMAMMTPPVPNPTMLSTLTPLAIAFGTFGNGLISTIDEQRQ